MSDEIQQAPAPAPKKGASTAPATSFDLTLDEFCRRASASKEAGPELLGGFHAHEVAVGRTKASEAQFRADLEAFRNQPA